MWNAIIETETGQEYSINTDATYPYKPPRYGQYGEGNQLIKLKTKPKLVHHIFLKTTTTFVKFFFERIKQF